MGRFWRRLHELVLVQPGNRPLPPDILGGRIHNAEITEIVRPVRGQDAVPRVSNPVDVPDFGIHADNPRIDQRRFRQFPTAKTVPVFQHVRQVGFHLFHEFGIDVHFQRAREIPGQPALPGDVLREDAAGVVQVARRHLVARRIDRPAHEHAARIERVRHGPRSGMAPAYDGDCGHDACQPVVPATVCRRR